MVSETTIILTDHRTVNLRPSRELAPFVAVFLFAHHATPSTKAKS